MKSAILGTLATASAIPAVALVATAPTSGAKLDLWLKEVAAKTAAAETKLDDAKSAIDDLQNVLANGGTVTGQPAPAPTDAHQHHEMPQTSAAALNPTMVNGLANLNAVSSGIDQELVLVKGQQIASSGKPDVVGAFRFHCEPSHLAYADPVMYPGDRSGKSHLHLFFGNTKADADSTYESLRGTGDSTCINASNRSAYWEPAMIQTSAAGRDEVVIPDTLNVYYKRRPASDPWYKATGVVPVNIPRGLRYIFGAPAQPPRFKCVDTKTWSNIVDWSADMPSVLAKCPIGAQLDVSVDSPSCWDGKNLDSPDHRSHMSYMRGGPEHKWVEKCPASHPYEIPTFTLQSMFTIMPADKVDTWRFSSDMMKPGARPGSTFHADWFGAWEDQVADVWQDWCINKLLTCHSGNLGNGSQMKESPLYVELKKLPPRRVSVPAVS